MKMNKWNWIQFIVLFLACQIVYSLAFAYGTDYAPSRSVNINRIHNAVPQKEFKSLLGNPQYYDVNGKRYYVRNSSLHYHTVGIASWYGMKFQGHPTSSGEPYDVYGMTAAHRTLPLPTYAKVKNLENDREVIVKINDRGPFLDDRVIDLSFAAAKKLGIVGKGTGVVEIETITEPISHQATYQRKTTPHSGNIASTQKSGTYLQVGAYAIQANADKFAKKLSGLHLAKVFITRVVKNQTPLFKVQLGPLLTAAQRFRAANQLEQLGITQTITVTAA